MKRNIDYVILSSIICLLSLAWMACNPECPVDPDFKVIGEDIVYAQREVFDLKTMSNVTVDLKMDVIEPCRSTSQKRPLIVYFHGYNILGYNKDMAESYQYNSPRGAAHLERIKDFARDRGCVVAIVDYVTAPLKWEDFALGFVKWPLCDSGVGAIDTLEGARAYYAMVRQGKDAIRFLKSKHDAYKIDLDNITVAGFSAGGGIAAGVGFINESNFRPGYTLAQPNVVYDANSNFPDIWMNQVIDGVNAIYHLHYTHFAPVYPMSIPRPDLGDIEGSLTNAYDSKVKHVVLFNTGMYDPLFLTQGDPHFFIYGSNQDEMITMLNADAQDPCMNAKQVTLFNEIVNRARSVGYVEGESMRAMEAPDSLHDFNNPAIMDQVWEFIRH